MALLATSRKAASCSPVGAAAYRAPGSSGSSDMTRSEKHLEHDHSSSWSHMTAPARRSNDATDGSACTTRDLRLESDAALAQSRMRWTAHLCQAAPWKVSSTARMRPSWASEVASLTPRAPRSLTLPRNADR